MPRLISEDSDQPEHPLSLIRVFAVRMKKAWVLSYPLSAQRRFWSDWADAQANLSLRWAHSHFVGRTVILLVLSRDSSGNASNDKMLWCRLFLLISFSRHLRMKSYRAMLSHVRVYTSACQTSCDMMFRLSSNTFSKLHFTDMLAARTNYYVRYKKPER